MAAGQKITICITGIQSTSLAETNADGEEAITTIQEVEAEYYQKGDVHYLFYAEQQEGFPAPWRTRVKQKGNTLEIYRQGPGGSTMYFAPGTPYRTEYFTPYGVMLLDIVTTAVTVSGDCSEAESKDRWPTVTIEYTLQNEGEVLAYYHLTIEQIAK